MIQVYLYSDEKHTEETRQILATLNELSNRFDLEVNEIQLPKASWISEKGKVNLPELHIGNFIVKDVLNQSVVESTVQRAQEFLNYSMDRRDMPAVNSLSKPVELSGSDKFALWFSRSYLWFISLLVLIYVGLPFFAPVLMKTGATQAAGLIYRGYRLVCHQLGYRSFYLFGEQAVYPRALAGLEGLKTFEEATHIHPDNLTESSLFVGNNQLGFKVALCQRDVAIYGSILLFAIIFALSKRKIKTIPWYVWLVVALGPIGLDGVSQLLSQMKFSFLNWLPVRESTPFLRVLTGFIFGWFTSWYAFPALEETLLPTRQRLELRTLASQRVRKK